MLKMSIYKIDLAEGERLLEKYYEGATSTAEEKKLLAFLKQKGLPERFRADLALLDYFDNRKQKPKSVVLPLLKWSSVAAILGLLFLLRGMGNEHGNNYTYINGEKYTDTRMAKAQALASLNTLSASSDEISISTENLQEVDLVESQLQSFFNE